MSLSRQDVLLGRALLAWGLVDRAHLTACAEDVRLLTAQGRPITLGQVLVQRGVLSIERYQAIIARLREVYLQNPALAQEDPAMAQQVQQVTAQLPQLNQSGRYTQQHVAPPAPPPQQYPPTFQQQPVSKSSTVERAVQGWVQAAGQVAADGSQIEFDFSPPTPSTAPPVLASRSAAPPPPKAAAGKKPQGPDAAIRRRLKVPPEAERFDIGGWTVETYLAEGAWGVVYKVSRAGDARPYALKVLKHFEPKPEIRQRFVQEAKTMAKLHHPGIVHVHDAGVANGLLWFVMDFMPGQSLQKVIDEDGALRLADGLAVMRKLCEAVAYAHSHSILHRDLKPENIIMSQDGTQPVLTDFGLAKDVDSGLNLTAEGQRIGTPLYMAPELLLEAEKATPQSEVYALGAILYQVLTGKVPFFAKSVIDLAELIEKGDMTPLRKLCPEASKGLEKLITRTLAKDPSKRPQTVADLQQELAGV